MQDDVRDVLNYCTFSLALLKFFQKSEREWRWRGGRGREGNERLEGKEGKRGKDEEKEEEEEERER